MRRSRWPRACGCIEEPGLEPGDEEGGLEVLGLARRERMRAIEFLSGAGLEPEGGGRDFVLHPDSSV